MKFCPKCEVKLKKDGSDLKCSKCGYIDGNTPSQQKKVVQEESTEAFNVFAENEGEESLPTIKIEC
jgi:DNA-directed RNA polymerase subunit M